MSKVEKITKLLEVYGKDDQRTDAWHAKRGQMLTASEIYKGLPDATPAQRYELIIGKLVPKDYNTSTGVRSLMWGTRFEPIAKEIYVALNFGHIRLVDTTCIPHPEISFLGASPDGIILTDDPTDYRYGKLVEFKCPITRKFTNETPVPKEYYHQMQLQMECTGIDECDYIEMEFKEMTYTEWVDSKCEYKSFFAISDDDKYISKSINDSRSIPQWRQEVLGELDSECRLYYWGLVNWRVKTVQKQADWLVQNLPSLQKVWDEIQEHKKSGTLPQSPKEKATLVL